VSSPKHEQLTATLRDRIERNFYEDGRIPSEASLSNEFQVSRTTVRAALTALQNEGLLRAQSGVGYFVRRFEHFGYRPQDDFQQRKFVDDADSFTLAAGERNPSQRIEVSMVPAPRDVARHLRVPEGEFVVLRSRLRLLDGEPFQLNDSYYPRDVAEGTEVMLPDDKRRMNEVLAEHGHAQVRALDEIWVRMPRPAEADRLRIPPGTPVAEHIITGFTAEGRAVRMVRAVLPGDRNVITFDRVHPDYEAEPSE
jgi:GntR family transcriptional regulator